MTDRGPAPEPVVPERAFAWCGENAKGLYENVPVNSRGRLLAALFLLAATFATPGLASAHPAPFSYLDLVVSARGISGTLVVHDYDIAQELKLDATKPALDPRAPLPYRDALVGIFSTRLTLALDGRSEDLVWGAIDALPERQSLRLSFSVAGERPGRVQVQALLFPYDSVHQTFVNFYEDGALSQQTILDAGRQSTNFYAGTTQGRLAVVRTFMASGIEHILIGPDHVLFLLGLLLLRGSFHRLVLIVTAFTVGHSVTLSLAALDVLSPASRLIEPLIALTIIVVGVDNLFVLRSATQGSSARDIRAWLSGGFGLIHGFGFATVLKEFGLPDSALGWSLFAFNVGVEIGQLAIVVVIALGLEQVARRSAVGAANLARAGSIGVILAGIFWFVQRTFFPGG